MRGLLDADLGADALVRPGRVARVRRVRHGTTRVVVDTPDEVGLVVNLSDGHQVDGRLGGVPTHAPARLGTVTVLPPGCRVDATITAGAGGCRALLLGLPWAAVVRAAAAHGVDAGAVALRPRVNADDAPLARVLYAAAAADDGAGEEATDAVAEYLVRHHTPQRPATPADRFRGGIPRARLRRVLDRIAADLRAPLPLATLAAEAGVSPFHFAREFARATGLPPHQYVVRERVRHAVALLARPELSVGEVASGAGFAHVGHLARHLRRLTGLTPAAFRTRVLPDGGSPHGGSRHASP